MTLPWMIAAAAAGLLAGPRIRASVFARSTEDSQPRRACPECSRQVLAGRWLWCSLLPVTGRCPHCKARIGPYLLAAELVTALVLAVIAARVPSGWELAALAWLALIAVPLAFIDIAVQRLPDLLTISAFAGTLVLLAAADGAAHQPWPLVRAVIGAAALAGFYLALWLVFPDQLGLGDVKIAASIGLVLAWGSWSELFLGALAGAFLAIALLPPLPRQRGRARRRDLTPLPPALTRHARCSFTAIVPGGAKAQPGYCPTENSMVIKEPTASTFVFRREAGTWLTALVWHPRLECWLPSGGHVESTENTEEAAIREAREFPVKSTR